MLVGVTIALVLVTYKYVKSTAKIANATVDAAVAARESAASAAEQARSSRRLTEQAERVRFESAFPHVKAQRGSATNHSLKVKVSCDGPGTAIGVEAQWIVGDRGGDRIPIAASMKPGDEVERAFNLSEEDGRAVLRAMGTHEGPLFRIFYRDRLGGIYEAHASTYDAKIVPMNEIARVASGVSDESRDPD